MPIPSRVCVVLFRCVLFHHFLLSSFLILLLLRLLLQVREGCWYYEVLLITPGVMQIGWATKNASFLNDDGYGIGDDNHSISYDGCRQLVWHNAKSYRHTLPQWKSGSILGCLLDISAKEVIFSLDGEETFPHCNLFHDGQ